MNEYQEQILDHYKNPRNYGVPKWKPSTLHKSENISCGDEIEVYLQIDNDLIKEINFTGRGCSISIASASLLSEELRGKKITEIMAFSDDKLKELLGIELTPNRKVCATLSLKAIKDALSNL